ncbi:3-hydroxyacyl-CoA dehydrogenase [Nitrosomonas sp. HPC101]|uniref:3-hydroxyacyl-CoA dehydrogenase/enoyl-CoA hydratase family protein n=1 Tax=Nitrosomonas sp. HPC101 TaxID=1658667 RepID=UPI00136C0843|nr:3-hydroxyacyl-CoA dehydrogenase/enoyl-CoA hydratase family protein [Nitrosomonas sp. HPC101]MXS85898.1 3-hydroxyacyl-CoA dehydrogenase [Nitrosomonas sp. HPC101]
MSNPFIVRKAAVLGAGVMGAQIAAHLINANIETLLFELSAESGNPDANVLKAIGKLKKQEPAPLSVIGRANFIEPANYEQHLEKLGDCDLVIEAIAEQLELKSELYEKIAPYLNNQAILVSNTSGLPINQLATAVPEALRSRFCGVHFFNPPRYMYLVELIPSEYSDQSALDMLESFLVTSLGKGVVRAKDTPNFLANRVGVFSMLAAMHHARQFGLEFDLVDKLTGTLIGRPKSATFRTADLVGLDVLMHVVQTMRYGLEKDPWHLYYALPDWLQRLVDQGALGQKSSKGIYQKQGKDIHVLHPDTDTYQLAQSEVDGEVEALLKQKDPVARFAALHDHPHPQAQFLWAIHRDLFHYCAVHLESIAHNARDLDLAIRWGFGWQRGPFELWQAAGWNTVTDWIEADSAAGKAMAKTPLPAWVRAVGQGAVPGVHSPKGSYAPVTDSLQPRSQLPVYRRQPFPDRLVGEEVVYGETILETDALRMWHTGDRIAIVSFKTKKHTIDNLVLQGMQQVIAEAERHFHALVIWQTEPPFSLGANLQKATEKPKVEAPQTPPAPPSTFDQFVRKFKKSAQSTILQAARSLDMADRLMAGKLAEVEMMIAHFQQISQQLRYSIIPTVAAVDNMALGGGCEFVMHCDRAVATMETYIGLVEAGVGLLPAGGGCKEFALRAARNAVDGDPFLYLKHYFQTVAMAQLAKSAEHAKALYYLKPADVIVMNRLELLHVAKAQALALAEAGYRPPLRPREIVVAGATGAATIKSNMVNLLEGGFISEHDYLIGSKIAHVMCGGDIVAGSRVDEEWLLKLERAAFIELLATEKTQDRIAHTLKTGKPLRN